MKGKFCQILINCPKKGEANKILDTLLEKRLVAADLLHMGLQDIIGKVK